MAYINREQVCENCNNKIYCGKEKCPVYKVSTADVVPKSEVDMSQYLLKEAWKRIEELDKLCGELQKAKAEFAREIFEEIERNIINSNFEFMFVNKKYFVELKKKHIGGNNESAQAYKSNDEK